MSFITSLFGTVTSKLTSYALPLLGGVTLCMAAGLGYTFYLYHNEVKTNGQLTLAAKQQQSTIEQLQKQLTDERSAAQEVAAAKSAVEKRYGKLLKASQNIKTSDSVKGLDPDAVAEQLCGSNLANPDLCGSKK